jgi:16S rRNA (cytosine967-C5)-methyltransferase
VSSVAPARAAAFEVVRRVFEQDAYADRAFAGAASGLDARDRALAQRIAYGTVQRVRTIDHGIEQLGRRPVRKLDAPVLAALRLVGYQLGWLDVPAHAVVGESVELVRRAGLERATAFTNAVGRRLAERFRGLVASLPEGPLKHSYPDWIWDVWRRDLGEADALELMRAQNKPAETVVRLVRAGEGLMPGFEETDVPGAYRVERVPSLALEEGRVWPMSRGSQLAALAVGSKSGERVVDLCAAPGGKTAMLKGDVVAVEVNEARARELTENLRLMGRTDVRVVHADARELDEFGFDRALVDAPCSGLGVLARRPDLRWRGKPLPELQLALLQAARERVRVGGTIVYSVCTINADENEAVVDASGLRPDPSLGDEWPQFRHPTRPVFLLTTPHRHGTSGFFVARLTP